MAGGVIGQAEALLARGQTDAAIAHVADAAERADADALMRMATWHLIGSPLPRDLPAARAWLRRAVNAGHVDAALMEIALTANGTGAAADWPGALRLLRVAAANDPVAAGHLKLIEGMALKPDGTPSTTLRRERLPGAAEAFRLPAFFSREECAHVANAGAQVLEPAMVADPRTGRFAPHPIRTSDAGTIGPAREDLVIRALNLRIASASGTPVDVGEPLVVLRYAPGQQYRPHMDALPGVANQRVWTMIVYLNQGYGGGETIFPLTGLRFRGRAGEALLFRNVDAAARPLASSRHAGAPVSSGTKWVCTRWIRQRPLDPWAAG